MIGYFDTSAIVPLLVGEPSTPLCRRFWDAADSHVTSRLLYVESAAALAQAVRLRRVRTRDHEPALAILDELWVQLNIVEVDDALIHDAAGLARSHGLRGYDAVHCAAARQLLDVDLVAGSGDRQLLAAWTSLGLATLDTAQSTVEESTVEDQRG